MSDLPGTKWTHNDLLRDLAAHLRSTRELIVWEDMQLGPAGSPRPDCYAVNRSYSKFRPMSYEIKVSVADFRRDVTAGKWQDYLKYSTGVIFAVPNGLITKEDVPKGCGLLVRYDSGWRTVKGPTLQPLQQMPRDAWIKLLIDGIERQCKSIQPRDVNQWRTQEAARRRFGDEFARLMSDAEHGKVILQGTIEANKAAVERERKRHSEEIERIRLRHEAENPLVDETRTELCTALGIDVRSSIWNIQRAAREAVAAVSRDQEVIRLRGALEEAHKILSKACSDVASKLDAVDALSATNTAAE